MLRDLAIRIVKCSSCWDLSRGLRETSGAAETSAKVCRRHREQLKPLRKLCGGLGAIFSQPWMLESRNQEEVHVSYLSLLLSQDLLHHTMACIIKVSPYLYIRRYRDNRDGLKDTSAKCKMVWKSQLNNSATPNSHTDPPRCSQMHPDRLSAKRWALMCSETTSPVLLNVLGVVEQNARISWGMCGCLRSATKSNY